MENQKAGGLNSVGREEEWQEETGRELFGNCRNINIDDSSSFAVNTCCSGFWGIHRERLLRQFCYFLSVVHGVQLGTGGPQLVIVVANLDRKINFSYKSNHHFSVPWLDQEPQEPSCESSPNKTVKDSRTWTWHHVRVRCQVTSSRDHTTLWLLGLHQEGCIFSALGGDKEEAKMNIVEL